VTLTATNQAAQNSGGLAAQASYIRITEPALLDGTGEASLTANQTAIDAVSAKANPFTGVSSLEAESFFDRFTIESITASGPSPAVDLGATTVWLLHYNADSITSTSTTADLLSAMSSADLANVIGISATFQGSDPVTNGGSIAANQSVSLSITVRTRSTFRVSGDEQRLTVNAISNIAVPNTAFAQSYDPVQFVTPSPIPEELARGFNGALTPAAVYLSGGRIATTIGKSISPNTVTEPNRDTPLTVALTPTASSSTLPATSLTVADGPENSDFWDNVAFTGIGTITAPTGADQVRLCAYGAFDSDPPDWRCAEYPAAIADAVLPISVDQYPQVQGLKAEFSREDKGAFGPWWGNPAVRFQAMLRANTTSDGNPVVFPGSATNTVTATASNSTLGEAAEATSSGSAVFNWQIGTRQLALGKVANGGVSTVFPGDSQATADIVPFDLTIRNNGTGYLHLASVVDQLPVGLHYSQVPSGPNAGDPYLLLRSGGSAATTISTEPALSVGIAGVGGQTLEFSWPDLDGQDRLLPGETLTITVYAWMELGVYQLEQFAENTLQVTTGEDLAGAAGLPGSGPVTFSAGVNPRLATTTAAVTPHPGTNFRVAIGVVGSLGTASPSFDPEASCNPTITAHGESSPRYFSAPCVSDSAIGTTDSWLLHAVNAGTTAVSEVTFFKALPAAEDLMLVAGTVRGSTYRPHLVQNSLLATAQGPDGEPIAGADVDVEYEVSFDNDACTGTWTALASDPSTVACTSAGETWEAVDPGTDWPNVRAIRVKVTFNVPLGPAGTVDVRFDTVNVPETGVGAHGGARVEMAAENAADFAWGQFGVTYSDATRIAPLRLSPPKVGVTLASGSFSVLKQITGFGTEYAPSSFAARLACTIDYLDSYGEQHQAPLTFDGSAIGTLALETETGLTAEVNAVPLGAQCQVTEAGEVGEFGEESRYYTDNEFTISAAATPQVVLTNVYAAPQMPFSGAALGTPLLAAILFLLAGAALLRVAGAKRSR
jgi:hypothetical protein